jgi:membrane-associated phospholipid phosphatase
VRPPHLRAGLHPPLTRVGLPPLPARWLEEAERVDVALYQAISRTDTPGLDRALSRLSRAADYSRLSLASAAILSIAGGPSGREAARAGLSSLAVTAAIVNLVLKPLGRRRRPERAEHAVPPGRHVRMPVSRSMPSGHSAAAFAFATGAGSVLPLAGLPLHALAAAVAYSRVHTGVHYPGDVVAGALIGTVVAHATSRMAARAR